MSGAVWHWQVPIDDQVHELEMPVVVNPEGGWQYLSAPIGHVAIGPTTEPRHVSLWAWTGDTGARKKVRRFVVVGTGHPTQPGWEYVGTAFDPTLPLVWHLMEVIQ